MIKFAEHRDPGPQRRRALVLRAAPDQHPYPPLLGDRRQLAGQPGLPDPRVTDQADQRPLTRLGEVEQADEGGELIIAADHRPRRPSGAGGLTARTVPRRRPGNGLRSGDRPLQHRLLPEDCGLQRPQLAARLQPELVVEQLAYGAQNLQRVRLPTGSSQREGPEPPEPFPQRIAGGQRLQLRGNGGLLTEPQPGEGAVFQPDQLQLAEPGPFSAGVDRVVEFEIRLAAPEFECGIQAATASVS